MLAAARPGECSNTTSYNKIFVAEILAKKGHSPLANFVLRLRGGGRSAAPDRVGGARVC